MSEVLHPLNPEFLINGVLKGVLGGGRKRNKSALNVLTRGGARSSAPVQSDDAADGGRRCVGRLRDDDEQGERRRPVAAGGRALLAAARVWAAAVSRANGRAMRRLPLAGQPGASG